jgi:hypothetical protein
MSTQIQFGDKYVKINESVFYLTPPALESLKAWYNWSVKFDTKVLEELRIKKVEYLAKAFELLKPQSSDEALHYLTLLLNAFVQTDYKIKEIIDKIYANKSGNIVVREL